MSRKALDITIQHHFQRLVLCYRAIDLDSARTIVRWGLPELRVRDTAEGQNQGGRGETFVPGGGMAGHRAVLGTSVVAQLVSIETKNLL
jgi:hypothetical protein